MRIAVNELQELIVLFKEFSGIQYDHSKIYLFENRLVRFVGESSPHKNYRDLIKALKTPGNPALKEKFVNALTTNYSFFFREPVHFRFLSYIIKKRFYGKMNIRLWSAAASSGQEAYSMAIIMHSFLSSHQSVKILGTDIARDQLTKARGGSYPVSAVSGHVHDRLILNFFNESPEGYTVQDKIKKMVSFRYLNLLEPYPFKKKFHIIFLRNVLIYFKPLEKTRILNQIARYLHPDGFLILSLSESLTGLKVPFEHVSNSIYRLKKLSQIKES